MEQAITENVIAGKVRAGSVLGGMGEPRLRQPRLIDTPPARTYLSPVAVRFANALFPPSRSP